MIEKIFSNPEIFWFIIGLVLFLLELVIPGFFIFFFGLGAWVTALVCLIANPDSITNVQIIIFAVTSVLALVALRRIIQKKFFYSKGNQSEEVEDEFTGKEAMATTDFDPDKKGKVEFKGTTWKAESTSEIKEGQTVIIIEKENFKLIVEPKK
ncbi:MAG: NfeD family protein [Bacteroidia bacterium]|nr:NfeD family protein [Bacteroidia bacterium]